MLYYYISAPSSDTSVTGTVAELPRVADHTISTNTGSYPTQRAVQLDINAESLVQLTDSYRGSKSIYYLSSAGNGAAFFTQIPSIASDGLLSNPGLEMSASGTWTQTTSTGYVDYKAATLAYLYNEPNWTASHLIYYAGQNIPSASEIHFSKCTRGKMYTVHHCSKNSVDFKLTNDLADGTTLTVYDGSASAYQLTTGYSIILFPANCTKSITATFMIYNTSLYITYGY